MIKCYPTMSAARNITFTLLVSIAQMGAYATENACKGVSLYARGPFLQAVEPVQNLTVALQGKEVLLQWDISESGNILHFEIQHSSNGRSFSAIGTVKLKLNQGAAEKKYSFLHAQPVSGKNYYRVKTVYINKSAEQSNVVPIQYASFAETNKEASIYPNPSQNGIIYFSTKQGGKAQYQLSIFDLDGKLITQKYILSNQTTIIRQLKNGIYLYEIFRNDDRIDHGQLIVKSQL